MSRTAIDVGAALTATAARLREAGIEAARLEARLLLGHVLDRRVEWVVGHTDATLDRPTRTRLEALARSRVSRRPLAQVLGRREFWGLPFEVTPDTLDPRPDSETVVRAALDAFPDRNAGLAVLDLGTGTGCLLLSILSERPWAAGVGIDISEAALAVARRNAAAFGLADRASFALGDWGAALRGRFDLVVANPPYVADDDFEGLEPEVARFEPRVALAGGADGLRCHREIVIQLPRLLGAEGRLVLEVGAGQAEPVSGILAAGGLRVVGCHRDLGGIERCVAAAVDD